MRRSEAAMMVAIIILAFFCFGFLAIWQDAHAELIKGTLTYIPWDFVSAGGAHFGIEFSQSKLYSSHLDSSFWEKKENYDVMWSSFYEGSYLTGQLIELFVVFDEVKVAPESGYQPWVGASAVTYVCITKKGNYAKFTTDIRCSENGCVTDITYVYQTDGSRNLDESTMVKPSTWGGLKSFLKRGGPR